MVIDGIKAGLVLRSRVQYVHFPTMQDDTFHAPYHFDDEGGDLYRAYPVNPFLTPSEPEPSMLKLSTTFNYEFLGADGAAPDSLLIACDGTHFAVVASKLRAVSCNDFGSLLLLSSLALFNLSPSSSNVVLVPLTSTVLNLLLHAVYGLSTMRYTPAVDLISVRDDHFLRMHFAADFDYT